jgi:hypothetical protein
MQQFYGGAKEDEFLLGSTKHVSHEQVEGRTDAFPSRREEMFEGRAQVWMVFIPGLFANPLFYQF